MRPAYHLCILFSYCLNAFTAVISADSELSLPDGQPADSTQQHQELAVSISAQASTNNPPDLEKQFARIPVIDAALNDEARKEMSLFWTNMTDVAVIRGRFEQYRTIKGLKKIFKSEGTFLFSREKGVHWNVSAPLPAVYLCSDKDALQLIDGKAVRIGKNKEVFYDRMFGIIKSLQDGDTALLERVFEVHFTGNQNAWVIRLKAKEKNLKKAIQEVAIAGGRYIDGMDIVDSRENVTMIRFKELNTSADLAPDEKVLLDNLQ